MITGPNYTISCDPPHFEQLFGWSFEGPGWYLGGRDSLLVTPNPPALSSTPETVWNVEQPEGTLYIVQVFNAPFAQLVYSCLAFAPTRCDQR